jgi:hypothetical protein
MVSILLRQNPNEPEDKLCQENKQNDPTYLHQPPQVARGLREIAASRTTLVLRYLAKADQLSFFFATAGRLRARRDEGRPCDSHSPHAQAIIFPSRRPPREPASMPWSD